MKIHIERQGNGFQMLATNEQGNELKMDASPAAGGHNLGFRPMENLLAGLGGCSAIDILQILYKQRQTIKDFKIEVEAERQPNVQPSLFQWIRLTFKVWGEVEQPKLERAIQLSVDKYCSVFHILKATAPIEVKYELNPALENPTATGLHVETQVIRTQIPKTAQREHSTPLYLTSSFTFDSAEQAKALFSDEEEGNIYSRFSNPNTDELIQKMCLLEGTQAGFATASGMAAIFASLAPFLRQGDHIVVSRSIFGNTHRIVSEVLPKWGVEYTYVDLPDLAQWQAAIRSNTRWFFAETPSNPALDLVDLQALCDLAHAHNILVNIDNCFATPCLQKPALFGADIVTHSATKWMDGQGRVLGGLVLGTEALIDQVYSFSRCTGPTMSAFNAWILSKSLETLPLRMERHCQNAAYLAAYFDKHPEIETVKYPHLHHHPQYELARRQMHKGGGLFTMVVKGGVERGRRFLNALRFISHTANLGDTRTIATHPASTTHSKLSPEQQQTAGIYPGLIRFSVGLEHPDDVIADIEQALAAGV